MQRVTKKFVKGMLKGLEVIEVTSVPYELNKTYKEWNGKNSYKIIKIEPVKD